MEIKAELRKPYEEKTRIDFIVENNHQYGYEIRETELALEAWGYTEEEKEEQQKQTRIVELENKINTLKQESVSELLYGNEPNVHVYKDVIQGLIDTMESLKNED